MYPSFTGNSRRTRNVNLSGQNQNPFSTAWSPASGSTAAKTVSHAQVERQHRQQERERLRAARNIQRAWLGHREREQVRQARRREFDHAYSRPDIGGSCRSLTVLPLLLSFFRPGSPDDLQRLALFTQELKPTDIEALAHRNPGPYRLRRLSEVLVNALAAKGADRQNPDDDTLFLNWLAQITTVAPLALAGILPRYYQVLATLCNLPLLRPKTLEAIKGCVRAPIQAQAVPASFSSATYESLALNFLTVGNLSLVEDKDSQHSANIDPDRLAEAIINAYAEGLMDGVEDERLFWLLSHFIDLNRIQDSVSQRLAYLKALHQMLTSLAPQIILRLPLSNETRDRSPDDDDKDEKSSRMVQPLPAYIARKLRSLVGREGIAELLSQLTRNFKSSTASGEFEGASLLAEYTVTLLRCFPTQGDDIRMRLFLGDISSQDGDVPVNKYLWQSLASTSLFREIEREPESVVGLVRSYLSKPASRASGAGLVEISHEQEWTLLILFLELYVFILRLSDDDDFFSGIHPRIMGDDQPPSRIRSCSLSLQDIKHLTVFLKNLAFTLHYNAAGVSQGVSESGPDDSRKLESYLGLSAELGLGPEKSAPTARKGRLNDDSPDLNRLRSIVTSALRMIYDRDSRRPFLPGDHWLMTSKFDMDGFVTAVVAEQERQEEELAGVTEDEGEDEDEEMVDVSHEPLHTAVARRLYRNSQIEQLRARQKEAHRSKLLAVIGPKLEVLRHMPFVIPFATRVQIFRQFVQLDKHKRRQGMDAEQWRMSMIDNPFLPGSSQAPKHRAKVRRGEEFEDAYEQFFQLGDGLKEPIHIQFIDQFGEVEAGIDGGGVTKEFLIKAIEQAFLAGDNNGYFASNKQGLIYPNPFVVDREREMMRVAQLSESEQRDQMVDLNRRFEFLGRIVGKCLYEGILIDVNFAGFFLLKWATGQTGESSYRSNVNDLRDLDEELYQGMLRLKNYAGNVADLGLDFTIEDQTSGDGEPVRTMTRNLVPKGEGVTVTNDNRLLYITYVARHRLVVQPQQQTAAFLRGLRAIIAPNWLSMFNQVELQRLVGGDSSAINIDDLRRNTVYSGLYGIGDDGEEHPTVQLFWKVMASFSDQERRDLVKYVTSTPRAPLLGFSQLTPRFSIRDGGVDQRRLPSTSTCVNLLKLPRYEDEETLRAKLLYAITSGAGFDLS